MIHISTVIKNFHEEEDIKEVKQIKEIFKAANGYNQQKNKTKKK